MSSSFDLPPSAMAGNRKPTRGVLVAPNYLLTCQFDSMGPSCVLEDPGEGTLYRIDAFNRAAFVYAVLERMHTTNDGWVPCDVVARAVWGRRASANNVNTLVYRIRRELKAAGFNPDFLEVKRGHVRLCGPEMQSEPDHTDEITLLNSALSDFRDAETDDEKAAARERMQVALERMAIVPGLFVEPRQS
ncbi:MAG: hypothetical protein R3F61_08555 [Myxococcota bacterium]